VHRAQGIWATRNFSLYNNEEQKEYTGPYGVEEIQFCFEKNDGS
jgi:hypothetical protein